MSTLINGLNSCTTAQWVVSASQYYLAGGCNSCISCSLSILFAFILYWNYVAPKGASATPSLPRCQPQLKLLVGYTTGTEDFDGDWPCQILLHHLSDFSQSLMVRPYSTPEAPDLVSSFESCFVGWAARFDTLDFGKGSFWWSRQALYSWRTLLRSRFWLLGDIGGL